MSEETNMQTAVANCGSYGTNPSVILLIQSFILQIQAVSLQIRNHFDVACWDSLRFQCGPLRYNYRLDMYIFSDCSYKTEFALFVQFVKGILRITVKIKKITDWPWLGLTSQGRAHV